MQFFNLLWDRQPEQQREMLCDRGKIGIMDRINPSRCAADSARHHVRTAAVECSEELEQRIEWFAAERASRTCMMLTYGCAEIRSPGFPTAATEP